VIGQAPMGQAPMGQAPMGQGPMGQAPMGQAPRGQAPMGQGPISLRVQCRRLQSDPLDTSVKLFALSVHTRPFSDPAMDS
jgi:hypothetical protein